MKSAFGGKNKLFKLAILLIGFCTVFSFANVLAADGDVNGVIISPPLAEKQANPGSVYSDTIKVTNPNAAADLDVTVGVEDFIAKGEDGQQTFLDPKDNNSSYSLGKWLTVAEKTFTLKANESKVVNYTINVPANASPGGHYGVIFFSPTLAKNSQTSGNAVVAIPKIGGLILFTVPGLVTYNGQITTFEAGKKSGDTFTAKRLFIDSNNLVDYLTKFQNSSSTHVKPAGEIIVKNVFGKEVGRMTVNEKEGNVLPGSTRKFDNQSEIKHGFGPYDASVTLAFGENNTTSATYSFWIVPWKETTGAVIVIIILITIIRRQIKKKKNNQTENNNN